MAGDKKGKGKMVVQKKKKRTVGTLQQGYPLLLQQGRTRVVIRSCAEETE